MTRLAGTFLVLSHIWIGGFHTSGSWIWKTTEEPIPAVMDNGYPPWVLNNTYFPEREEGNICLNMDRENHIQAMFYGTVCYYPQAFICQYGNLP